MQTKINEMFLSTLKRTWSTALYIDSIVLWSVHMYEIGRTSKTNSFNRFDQCNHFEKRTKMKASIGECSM